MHDVLLIRFFTVAWDVSILIVRLLLNHGLRVDSLHDFFFRELFGLEVLTKGSLLIGNIKIFGGFMEASLTQR